MYIRFNSKDLQEFINKAQYITDKKIIIVADDTIKLIREDDSSHVSCEVSGDIIQGGVCVISKCSWKKIKDFNGDIYIKENELSNGDIKLNVLKMNKYYSEFNYEPKRLITSLDKKEIKNIIAASHSINKGGNRYAACQYVYVSKDKAQSICDISISERKCDLNINEKLLLDTKILKELDSVDIYTDRKHYIYINNNYTYVHRVYKKPMDIDKIKPKEFNAEITVGKEFKNIVKKNKENNVYATTFYAKENSLVMGAYDNDTFKRISEIECSKTNDIDTIILNTKYLYDAIRSIRSDFTLKIINGVNPVVIEKDNIYELVLPIRVSNMSKRMY